MYLFTLCFLDDPVAVCFCPGVDLVILTNTHSVKWWLRDVDVAAIDEWTHIPVEEVEKQCPDMVTVYVCIRHNDDFMVAQLVDIESNGVFIITKGDTSSKSTDNHLYRLIIQSLIDAGLFNADNLAEEWKNGLGCTITSLFSRTAC